MDENGSGGARSEEEVLDAIEARRRRPRRKVLDEQITLSHGAGGKSSHDLIEALFLRELRNPLLEPLTDSAVIDDGEGGSPSPPTPSSSAPSSSPAATSASWP